MDLVTRFLTARRDKLLMKVGCWLVCFSLVLGLMLPQQRAEALVAELTIGSVAALAASYLCACGLPLVTQGMDRDALVSSVQRLIQEFLDTELGGITIQDWLGNVWDLTVMAGKLLLGRPLTDEFVSFAQWVAGKYAVQAGENVFYNETSSYVTLADGSKFYLCTGYDVSDRKFLNPGTPVLFSSGSLVFSSGARLVFTLNSSNERSVYWYHSDGSLFDSCWGDQSNFWPMYIGIDSGFLYFLFPSLGTTAVFRFFNVSKFDIGVSVDVIQSLGFDRAPSMSYIPEGIAAEQGIALDVGAAATMDLDLVLQGVLDDVLAGELTSTMEAAGEAVVNPPAEEITDVDGLGLPALGAALTSRFPFSIPWDFFRAVSLLAAPAKAPYFEVDFMEPLADDVGGWNGSTTVILDFSEYAIIGQISRWTSTIGFCLMLAGATKRLIWTA